MKNKKGLVAVIIVGIVLVIAGILLVFLLPKKSNKEIFANAFKKSLGLVSKDSEGLVGITKKFQEKIEKSNYKLTIDLVSIQDEAGSSRGTEVLYFGDKKMYFKGNTTSNDITTDLEAMLKDNKLYFGMKGILSKVYYIDKIDELLNSSNASDPFIEKVVDYSVDSFMDALRSKEVTESKVERIINGVKYKTTVYGYTFTGETLYDFVVELSGKIKNDKDFCDQLNNFLKTSGLSKEVGEMTFTKDMLDAVIDQLIKSAESLKSLGKLATYTVYMYKDEAIGAEAVIYNSEKPTKFEYYNVTNNDKSYFEYSGVEGGKEVFKLVIDEKTKGNGDISFSLNGEETVKGYVKENSNGYEIKLNGTKGDGASYVQMNINNNNSGTIKIVSDISNTTIDYKLEQVDKIPDMDITGSTSIDNMTENDKKIIEAIFGMFSKKNNYIDYDYDYEF